jgi:hypothetical protein
MKFGRTLRLQWRLPVKSGTKRWSRWSGDIDLLVRRLCEFHILVFVNATITYVMASEVIEVPENSEDAKRWPRWIDPEAEGFTTPLTLPDATAEGSTTPLTLPDDMAGPSTQPSVTTKPPAKKPGPRKSRTTLSALPALSKAKKISTLDKSAMDWQAHIQNEQASGIKDELEANRRSGGYLEKVEFLQRVGDRKEENLDTLRSRKRRKI